MNGYQKIVLVFGGLFLFLTIVPLWDKTQSTSSMEVILQLSAIVVATALFLYSFKDLGKKKGRRRKK
jgi:hypothetical protein